MLWLAIQLPNLAVESVAGDDSSPRVVADRHVLVANAAALRAGIQLGATTSTARALLPQLEVVVPDGARTLATLVDLAPRLSTVTSDVCVVEDGPALLGEIAGSVRLFGSISAVIDRAIDAFQDAAVTLRWAVAPTPSGALLLATERPTSVTLEVELLRVSLARLPVQCLPLPDSQVDQLVRVGMRRIGDVLKLPRAGLARRLGTSTVQLLDRLVGLAPDLRPRWTLPGQFSRRLEWPAPVENIEALTFPLRRLVGDLSVWLALRGSRATSLLVFLEHEGRAPSSIEVASATGSADPAHLLTLMSHSLAAVELPAPITAVSLQLTGTREAPHVSASLFHDQAAVAERASALIERLQARLGANAVYGITATSDPRPDFAQLRTSPGDVNLNAGRPRRRPTWLLAIPQPIAPPGADVLILAGPERIESGWWDGADARRDYYLARNRVGQTLWIYQDARAGTWSLHGMFG